MRDNSVIFVVSNKINFQTGTYAAAIAGRYGWEGLGGQGMGCEWLVWEGLGGLGMGCEWLAGLVSRVCVYVDWRGWEVWGWVVNG